MTGESMTSAFILNALFWRSMPQGACQVQIVPQKLKVHRNIQGHINRFVTFKIMGLFEIYVYFEFMVVFEINDNF